MLLISLTGKNHPKISTKESGLGKTDRLFKPVHDSRIASLWQTNIATIGPRLQQPHPSLMLLSETIHSPTHSCDLNDKSVMLKRVRLIVIHEIAPPLLLHLLCCSFGHNVQESCFAICHGWHVRILLGSTHLGLCDHDFPQCCAKSCNGDDNEVTILQE